MPEREYELLLADGAVARWTGASGEDAARRYAAQHPGAEVRAWRAYPRTGAFALGDASLIIEPGDPRW